MDEQLIAAKLDELEAELRRHPRRNSPIPRSLGDQNRYREVIDPARRAEAGRRAYPALHGSPKPKRPRPLELAAAESDAEMVELPSQTVADERARRRSRSSSSTCGGMLVPKDPNDDKDVIVEIRAAVGGDEAGIVGRRPLSHVRAVCRAPRLGGRADRNLARPGAVASRRPRSPSRARAPTPGSSTRPGRTGSSGYRRPSPRAGSTPRSPPLRCFPRSRMSRSTSTTTISRSRRSARPVPAASRSTPPTRRCGSPTSRPGSSCRARTRSRSCRTSSRRCGCCGPGSIRQQLPSSSGSGPTARRSQVGTGERAEKIRTYNFKENRVTDHRIGLTVHSLPQILDGDLDDFHDALIADESARRLEEG